MDKEIRAKRGKYALLFALLLCAEVFIALFVHDSFIRPYVGDALVVVVVYAFIRVIVPEGVRLLPLYVFIFAAAVELSQYFHLAEALHLENSRFLSVLMGATFDIKDILCYALGCAIIYLVEKRKKVKND